MRMMMRGGKEKELRERSGDEILCACEGMEERNERMRVEGSVALKAAVGCRCEQLCECCCRCVCESEKSLEMTQLQVCTQVVQDEKPRGVFTARAEGKTQ